MTRPHRPRGRRSTPAGEHRAVLLDEVLRLLDPRPGAVAVDCTTGWAGHSVELLRRAGATGKLIGIDLDADNLPRARERLETLGLPFALHHGNFAGLPQVLGAEGFEAADVVLADLGMSSMQLDDAERGFSYRRDGPLDMRMDRKRERSAAQLLATLPQADLAQALRELGDEPDAERIAAAIVAARGQVPLERTGQLAELILEATQAGRPWKLRQGPDQWQTHPAARTFQALRLLVNRELGNLQALLRALPGCLRPGGRVAIISFHSGEDRLVKAAFREGEWAGVYQEIAADPVRPTFAERTANPRARSAKMRWARRA
jgi:16S rRNA (cytosine1402-N4)-methyltransferase